MQTLNRKEPSGKGTDELVAKIIITPARYADTTAERYPAAVLTFRSDFARMDIRHLNWRKASVFPTSGISKQPDEGGDNFHNITRNRTLSGGSGKGQAA